MTAFTTAAVNADQLLTLSSERSGLTDFGELPFREGIDVLLWSLKHESGNPPERVAQVAQNLVLPSGSVRISALSPDSVVFSQS